MQRWQTWYPLRSWLAGKTPKREFKLLQSRRLAFDPLEERALFAVLPELVRDINSGAFSAYPFSMTDVNGTVFFQASDGTTGYELWKSDGTSSGTVIVKDIRLGANGLGVESLTNVNGTLYFRANDGTTGYELWKSDGTSTGTVLVRDILPGGSGSHGFPAHLTNVNGTLYFRADGGTGEELWKSDGTSAGTVLVKDIRLGTSGTYMKSLTNVNGTLYFEATDGTNGSELWKSDGTSAGTVLVKDIRPGGSSANPTYLTNVNGTLYFRVTDGTNGIELWKSDGTSAGTVLVKDILPGGSYSHGYPQFLTNVNGTLYFRAEDGTNGIELWKSDGTSSGTVLVKDILSGSSGSAPASLTNVNGTLYFKANNGFNGYELWKSDGTSAGTVLVKDIWPGTPGLTHGSNPKYLTNVNGTLFFGAYDDTNGEELWQSDGTSAGTVLVHNITPGSGNAITQSLTNVNGKLFFSADDGVAGRELWRFTPSAFVVNGTTVTVSGGNENNTVYISFSSPTSYTITLDGVTESFSTTHYNTINVNTGGGNDLLVIGLSSLADAAAFNNRSGAVTSSNYAITFSNVETQYVFGSTSDSAAFQDSLSGDLFWALPTYSIMTATDNSYFNEVVGFGPSITVQATQGGFDVAQLIGSSSNDAYTGGVASATLVGPSINFRADGFDQYYGYSGGGTGDTAVLNGNTGDDVMYGLSVYSILVASNIQNYVVGFPSVTANASTGNDIAILYDSQSDDNFVANPTTARLFGAGYSNRVNGFDQVHANAFGGNDTATLDGSSGNDVFYGNSTDAQLLATGVFYLRTNRFELTHVNLSSSLGFDQALFFDGPGNDQFAAAGNQAENLYFNNARNRVNAFDAVYAYSQNGGTNRRTITNPLAFSLVFSGTWL